MAAHRIPTPAGPPVWLMLLALVAPLAGGCASFKSSTRLDVGPFAENTVGMIGEVQRATKPVVWTYLKKYETLPSIREVRQAYAPARRQGDAAALDSLRAQDPEAAEAMPAGKRPAAAAVDGTENRILSRIETLTTLRGHLEQQFEEYRAQQAELDAIRIQARESTRLGRITLILWARSHRNLAAGVKVPAAINVMGMVQSAAGKATGIVVP